VCPGEDRVQPLQMPPFPIFARSAPAEAASVPLLRRQVVDFVAGCDVCASRTEDVRLAVSEALTNAVLHAYRGQDAPGSLEISAGRIDQTFEVTVRDHGSGMAPRTDSPGLGLGLPVIALMSDRYDVERPGGRTGTAIRMQFDCTPN
jgi:serine/threonine-protein kinase RsbW